MELVVDLVQHDHLLVSQAGILIRVRYQRSPIVTKVLGLSLLLRFENAAREFCCHFVYQSVSIYRPIMANIFRNLPSVNQLLESPQLKQMVETVNHSVVVEGVRTFLDDLRTQVGNAAEEVPIPSPSEIAEKIADWIKSEDKPYLRPVINGTGIILHTGLGRAPLAEEAIAVGAKTFWAQLGLWNGDAAKVAADAGLDVVMDRCTKIEHARFAGGLHLAGFSTGVISSKRR